MCCMTGEDPWSVCPGTGTADPLGFYVSYKHESSIVAVCFNFSPFNDFQTIFPTEIYRRQNVTLSFNINVNFVKLESKWSPEFAMKVIESIL